MTRATVLVALIAAALLSGSAASAFAQTAGKPRVILTQDGEVDDMDSFIRYLYYANEFDTAGIIYTSSTYHYAGNGSTVQPFRWTGTAWLNQYLDLYAQIRPNLVKHAAGYPTVEHLRSLYKIGNVSDVGEMTQVTEGSQWIEQVLLDDDPRPLYIQAWGGNNTTARALKSIEERYEDTPAWAGIVAKINRKVTLYNILDQDPTLNAYIRPTWPGIKVIDNQRQFWSFAYLWPFVTPIPHQAVLRAPWMEQHLLNGKGPLMERYRTYRDGKPTPGDDENNRWRPEESEANQNVGYGVHDFISEGDSPAYMFLFDFNGLRSSEDPAWGGWGGRFAPTTNGWIDTEDDFPFTEPGGLGTYLTPRRAYPLTRWFSDLQSDFASRVAWGVADTYAGANHAPVVSTPHLNLVASPGTRVPLTATVSDPDGNATAIKWWQYHEVDTYAGKIELAGADTAAASFVVPADARKGDTIHVILDVKDAGTPSISRYQRVVVTVGENVPGQVGGTVPATLSLTLGGPATFGAFTPGVAKEYTASTSANVISTAGDATLSVSEPGHLTNGAFSLPEPLRVELSKSAWTAPVSNDRVDITFKQLIKAGDALRTGTYSRTLTFTLSTTTP